MFFSKKDKNKDIDEIKKAMDEGIKDDLDDFEDNLENDFESNFEKIPGRNFNRRYEEAPTKKDQMVAPLFVKVDKYRELLTTVHEMKLFVSGIKQIFNVFQELESIRTEAIKVMQASVQRLERSVLEMDSELLRPRGVDFSELVESETEVKHIEDSLTDLQKQIAGMRRELHDLK